MGRDKKNSIKKKSIFTIIFQFLEKYSTIIHSLLLLVSFIIIYIFIFDTKLDLNGDNYNYINYASSILEGKGYSSPYSAEYIPTNWYPPGYSFILATVMLFVGKNIIGLKILNGLFFFGSILILFLLIKKQTNIALAFSVSLLLLLNTGLLRLSTIIMSEMPFVFFSIFSIYCAIKLDDHSKFWKSKYFYGAILSATLTFYLRTAGIVLITSLVLHWIINKRWKLAGTSIVAVIFLYLPWMIRNMVYGIKGRYMEAIMAVNPWRPEEGQINTISSFFSKMMGNLYDTTIRGFPETIFTFYKFSEISKSTIIIIGILTLLIILFGAWKLKKLKYIVILYILGSIAMFLVWHGGNGTRYVWPIVPFLFYCFFNGIFMSLSWILKDRGKKSFAFLPYLILILIFFYKPTIYEMNKMSALKIPQAYENYFEIARKVKDFKKNDIVVACRKPELFYFYSGVYVTNYLYSTDHKKVIKNLIESKVNFIVFEQLGYSSTGRYLLPAFNSNQELFSLKMHLENPDTFLYEFNLELAKRKVILWKRLAGEL